jgi:hypothetical protein
MGESAGILNHIILGSLGVIVGLVATFFGYGIFRLILPVLGFFYGYLLGSSLVEGALWGFLLGLLFALVLGFLSYAYWSLLVTVGGAIIGFSLGYAFGEWLNLWNWISVIIGVGLAVVFGVLWFLFKDLMVMWLTALAGAGIVAAGLAYFWPALFGWLNNEGNWIATILVIALGIVGFLVQMVVFASMKLYSEPPPGGPPYVYVPSGSSAPAGAK